VLPEVPPPREKEKLSAGPLLFVRGYRFSGNSAFTDEELAAVAAPFANREISSADLEAVRVALTRHYVEAGYLNSGAVIPDQQPSDGVIEIAIVEGRLESIEIEGNRYFRSGYLRRRVALAGEPPLNVHSLEERLQLLQQDPRIRRVAAELGPGARRGEAKLRLRVEEERPYRIWLELSNYEPPSIGAERARIGLEHQNLTGNGDWLSAIVSATEGLWEVSARYELPITASDTRLSFWFRNSSYEVVEEPFDEIDIEADSRTYGVGLSHPFHRSRHTDFTMGLNAEYRRSETRLLGRRFSFSPGVQDGIAKVSALRFFQEYTYRDAEQVLAARSMFSLGLDIFDATVNSKPLPDGQYLAWLGQLRWVRRLPLGIESVFRFDVQLSSDPLLPFEQYALGGHATVRGYRENQLVRDMGGAVSLEARIPILRAGDGRALLQLAPFVDYGYSVYRARGFTPYPRNLLSVGVGLRWSITRWMQLQAHWAERLKDVPEPFEWDLQDSGVQARLLIDFL
jgi:hemolysin activation/secretion protein